MLPRDFHIFNKSSKTHATSPNIGISTDITLLIDEASISMCAFLELGLNLSKIPVIRSSNRAPILMSKSHPCIERFASYVPCIPSIPNQFFPEAG